jgi:dihydroflavonol-4-reductase
LKTLVTGAGGLIGSSVVRALLEDGRDVRAMIRPGGDRRNIDGLDMEVVEGDLLDTDSLHRALKDCDKLYQLAAVYTHWHPKGAGYIRDVNIEGTRNILEAASRYGLERIIYTGSISSIGVFPDRLGTEDDWPDLEDCRRMPYRESKTISERMALDYAKNMPIVVVTPASPIGPRDYKPTPTGRTILDFLNGKMWAYVDVGMNLIDVQDLAKGFMLAEERGRVAERYLLGNKNMYLKELFDRLSQMTGLAAPKYKFPKPLLRVFAEINEFIANMVKVEPIASVEQALHTRYNEFVDCSKAVKELGLPQNDINIAIHKAVRYYLDTGAVRPERANMIKLREPG